MSELQKKRKRGLCLFLGLVGILVLALRFKHTRDTSVLMPKQVIGAAGGGLVFIFELMRAQQIPPAGFERLVDTNTGVCLALLLSHHGRALFLGAS